MIQEVLDRLSQHTDITDFVSDPVSFGMAAVVVILLLGLLWKIGKFIFKLVLFLIAGAIVAILVYTFI